jgi:transcriptional regulator GlxA family with amidase domain
MRSQLDRFRVAIPVTDGYPSRKGASAGHEPRRKGQQISRRPEIGNGFGFGIRWVTAARRSANPYKLRAVPQAVQFVREFAGAGKPIAAICHGPWMLVEAGLVKGRKLTSWPSLATDIRNAGG